MSGYQRKRRKSNSSFLSPVPPLYRDPALAYPESQWSDFRGRLTVFSSASDIPASANSYDATGNTVDLSLNRGSPIRWMLVSDTVWSRARMDLSRNHHCRSEWSHPVHRHFSTEAPWILPACDSMNRTSYLRRLAASMMLCCKSAGRPLVSSHERAPLGSVRK